MLNPRSLVILAVLALPACTTNGVGDFVANTVNELVRDDDRDQRDCVDKARAKGMDQRNIAHRCSSLEIAKRRQANALQSESVSDRTAPLDLRRSNKTLGEELESATNKSGWYTSNDRAGPVKTGDGD